MHLTLAVLWTSLIDSTIYTLWPLTYGSYSYHSNTTFCERDVHGQDPQCDQCFEMSLRLLKKINKKKGKRKGGFWSFQLLQSCIQAPIQHASSKGYICSSCPHRKAWSSAPALTFSYKKKYAWNIPSLAHGWRGPCLVGKVGNSVRNLEN